MHYHQTSHSSGDLQSLGRLRRITGSFWLKLILSIMLVLPTFYFGSVLTKDVRNYLVKKKQDAVVIVEVLSHKDKMLANISAAMDIENPVTRNYATQIAANLPGKYNLNQVIFLYDFLYKNWRYVSDPRGIEYLSSASNTISNDLIGDCDDFAILIATLIESIGGKARVSFAHNKRGGHAFAEVYIPATSTEVSAMVEEYYKSDLEAAMGWSRVKKIHYRPDRSGEGIWLNLDWTSKYPGGQYFDWDICTVYYPREGVYFKGK
jgi:hypothetical protein